MTRNSRIELFAKALLILGLTIIRIPRAYEAYFPWVIILLTLLPFWYMIVVSHLTTKDFYAEINNRWTRTAIQALIVFNILGLLIAISVIFERAFYYQTSDFYTFLGVGTLILLLAGYCYWLIKQVLELNFNKIVMVVGLIYFLTVIVGMLRGSFDSPFVMLFVYQFVTFVFFSIAANRVLNNNKEFIRYVFYGIFLYLGVNVILYLAKLENQAIIYKRDFDAVMLSLIGIDTNRVYYPLAEGINTFGMVGGAGFSMSCAMFIDLFRRKSKEIEYWITSTAGCVLGLFIILTTDSRGALLFAFIVAGLMVLSRITINTFVFMGIVAIQPAVLLLREDILQRIVLLKPLIRSHTGVLSGREVIWMKAIEELSKFKWIHMVGYGLGGQTKSGLVERYNYMFTSYVNIHGISLHHFGLQTVIDNGYIGLVFAYLLIAILGISLITKIKSTQNNQEYMISYALLLFIILAGSVSIAPYFYAKELFFLFPFIWIIAGINNVKVNGN